MNFRTWFEQNEDMVPEGHISPDDLYSFPDEKNQKYKPTGGFTFIYDNRGLRIKLRSTTHGEMRYPSEGENQGIEGRCAEIEYDGRPIYAISFWSAELKDLIEPCIKALREKIGDVPKPIILFTPEGNRLIDGNKWYGPKTSAAEMNMLRQLHLMKSPEKRDARKALGLFSIKKRPDAEYRVLQPEHKCD
ncbi:MAG: hypothetical protein M0R80_29700 [Proteobacteria bacterium]|jgi:hypothetical protein|nr:hypothetical protein [Pseudomonadota bacterium]